MRHGKKGIKFDFDDLVYFKNFLRLFFSKDITEVIGLDLIMHCVNFTLEVTFNSEIFNSLPYKA